jgi:hypothetical protein
MAKPSGLATSVLGDNQCFFGHHDFFAFVGKPEPKAPDHRFLFMAGNVIHIASILKSFIGTYNLISTIFTAQHNQTLLS